jgi:hypothetical protein
LTLTGQRGDGTHRKMHDRLSGEEPLNRNPARDWPAGAADLVPLPAAGSEPEPARRFSPLVALIVLTLLSFGTWAAIWAAVASLASLGTK